MDTIYYIFFGAIGIIIAVGIGIELSKNIDEFIISFLFWLLYIITIATFINIVLVVNYYMTMKDKKGIQGEQGENGDDGKMGTSGICAPDCRDSICEDTIIKSIRKKLKDLTRSANEVRFNNIYIKGKVKQMCGSKEFKQLVPYNGPQNLINYLVGIWSIWIDLIFASGKIKYFENIAAETEFDWSTENPFYELKKYDVFYWGLGKQYRPKIEEKCYDSSDGDTMDKNYTTPVIFRITNTNVYTKLGKSKSNAVSFWRPDQFTYKGAVYYPVGDLVMGPSTINDNKSVERYVGASMGTSGYKFGKSIGPERETILVSGDVQGPISYSAIWTNATIDSPPNVFTIWRPNPPVGFISLGDVITFDNTAPPTGESAPIRCVKQNLTKLQKSNGTVLWNTTTDYPSGASNALILGFKANSDTSTNDADPKNAETHCYNMSRTVIGSDANNLPASDINGNFYILDTTKFDSTNKIGVYNNIVNIPPLDDASNKVGNTDDNGYIKFPVKDSKYSILPYLNLKNNATLIHTHSQLPVYANIIPNAVTNSYSININNNTSSCLKYNDKSKSITVAICDISTTSQNFSIIFTGNKTNECKLQHIDSQNILCYKDNTFSLIEEKNQNFINYQLFIMQK